MNRSVALQKTNEGWTFLNEWELEEFVWNNLLDIFGFHPLARQHSTKGEICDILAISNDSQLVVIELKNVEDRYVINQLTRYYDNLMEEKPFKDKINYDLEILLLAICPTFHRHNLIDQKHSRLRFNLFCFSTIKENEEFYFHLSPLNETLKTEVVKINYQEFNWKNQVNDNVSEPPRILLDWLGNLSETEAKNLMQIRHQILSFDQRIVERLMNNKTAIYASKYGKDKWRNCAEFYFDKKSKKISLFLWLVVPSRKNKTILRMQIHTLNEYAAYFRYIPLKSGFISAEELKEVSIGYTFFAVPGNSFEKYQDFSSDRLRTKIKLVGPDIFVDYTESLVNRALQTWLERVSR